MNIPERIRHFCFGPPTQPPRWVDRVSLWVSIPTSLLAAVAGVAVGWALVSGFFLL